MRDGHRLLTLNIHGEPSGRDAATLSALTEFILSERPTVVALQEVCQSRGAAPLAHPPRTYRAAEQGVTLRQDLFVLRLAEALCERGAVYEWSYLPIKLGYGRYDEGVALLTSDRICETAALTVSRTADPLSWKTRRLIGARIGDAWYYSVHFGRFDDPDEPFSEQWERAKRGLLRHGGATAFLLGDFNCPAEERGGGFDLVRGDGWTDLWCLSDRQSGATVRGGIDGWRESDAAGLRIDCIFASQTEVSGSARLAFDGTHEPAVSDHFGVYVKLKGGL